MKRKQRDIKHISSNDVIDIQKIIHDRVINILGKLSSCFHQNISEIVTNYLFDFDNYLPIYAYKEPFTWQTYKEQRQRNKISNIIKFGAYFINSQMTLYFSVGHDDEQDLLFKLPWGHPLQMSAACDNNGYMHLDRCTLRIIYGSCDEEMLKHLPILGTLTHRDGYLGTHPFKTNYDQILWSCSSHQFFDETLPHCSNTDIHEHQYMRWKDFLHILGHQFRMKCIPVFHTFADKSRYTLNDNIGSPNLLDLFRMYV